jgi:hypothetical protein
MIPVTRRSLSENGFPVLDMTRSVDIPAPIRVWSDEQMQVLCQGFESSCMEERWNMITEGDRVSFFRSWTGHQIYEVEFVPCEDGWRIDSARACDDLDVYKRDPAVIESTLLEHLLYAASSPEGPEDDNLERRYDLALRNGDRLPRFVITKSTAPPVPITKPGYSIKHGRLADQHPLQREAYDRAFAAGQQIAEKALQAGRSAQDVYAAAARHEAKALKVTGIESSQHAGLAKGAVVFAWRHVISQ